MATILLAAAGAAVGAGFGGTVLGLSGAVIGRAVGATVGRAIDQRILGVGSDPVEVGRLDRLQLMGAGEGGMVPRTWGRMRLPGQIIWASPFTEIRRKVGGGKGAPQPKAVKFSYSVNLAIALCEGEILGVGRVWADGKELSPTSLDMRVYPGNETQMPDPAISASEGIEFVPAFRGTAYVVLENLSLEPFGNRVPQFSFEVVRAAQGDLAAPEGGFQTAIRGIALIPGTGEYTLATEKVRQRLGYAERVNLNAHGAADEADFVVSLRQMTRELPACGATSLVVSWFGDDLRCGDCSIRPKVALDLADSESVTMAWRAGGISADTAEMLPRVNGKSIYGGTPADESILQAITALKAAGMDVMFYPFVLMTQMEGNVLPDPYSGEVGQPTYPWRGRITLGIAPGRAGSSDGTAAASDEVQAFFGTAQAEDFTVTGSVIHYTGPEDWGYRRFILHYAHLCALAGGVEAFCIGSELRGLTTIMADQHRFPAVEALIQLAQDVRGILGPDVKISYAADWSEYFGYHRGSDVYFHLDPLWAHPEIDFIGIDNYMPLSDWRTGNAHADAHWGMIYNLDYLVGNVAGGEGFDWYYDSPEGQAYQLRKPIEDLSHGETWIYRYKDLSGWWLNHHHNRVGGERNLLATEWVPGSKPMRFTEYGCAAVDKGTNEPNRFFDPKSSESGLPRFSDGQRDDFIQLQYFRAMEAFWSDPQNNPPSQLYSGRMLDREHCFAWAWDARPYPEFPRDGETWADGGNWRLGHWLNGRSSDQPLASVVREVCESAGVTEVDTSRLYGSVKGYAIQDIGTARSALQPLAVVYGFDPVESGGKLSFVTRGAGQAIKIDGDETALRDGHLHSLHAIRLPDAEIWGTARLGFVSEASDFAVKVAEDADPASASLGVSQSDFPGVLADEAAQAVVKRWLVEGSVSRDILSLDLPLSRIDVQPGSILRYGETTFRVDRIETAEARRMEASRIEGTIYNLREIPVDLPAWRRIEASLPVSALWLDIPSTDGYATTSSPYVAVAARPWPGTVAVWKGQEDADYALLNAMNRPSTIGITQTAIPACQIGLFDRKTTLRVRLETGSLSSASRMAVLGGANLAAIGDGSKDNWEIFQFTTASLVAPDTYDLQGFLRGQLGTDGLMPQNWPSGSFFVLLDGDLQPAAVPENLRNVEQDYRIGLASKGPADADSSFHRLSFYFNNLRTYPVCHLRADQKQNGDVELTWIRRTRSGGDDWEPLDVPLSEEREQYQIRIVGSSGQILRTAITSRPDFVYSLNDQAADAAGGNFRADVAQISMRYGLGPWRSIQVGA